MHGFRLAFVLGFVVATCGGKSSRGTPSCPDGAEGCPCLDGGGCDPGLECVADLCTEAGTGCGNGVAEPPEACDLGDANDDEGPCKSDCTEQVCGDGFVGPREACDDANDANDDDCTNDCLLPTCGDGVVQEGEDCDDGNDVDRDVCPGTCQEAECGDGFVQDGVEACDDADAANTNGCLDTCEEASCGDGFVWEGVEACDDGVNDGSYEGCGLDCLSLGPFCGDGEVDGPESCDDGNELDGDGCNGDCTDSGREIWTRTHDGPAGEGDFARGVAVDSATDEIVVVGAETVTDQMWNVWVRKYGPDGTEIWTRTYDGADHRSDVARAVAIDSENGDVVVVGSEGVGAGTHIWVRKYDADGNEVWTETYDSPDNGRNWGWGVAVDSDGSVVVIGREWVAGEDFNVWVRKYDTDGNEIWARTHDGASSGRDVGRGVAVDSEGNILVAGYETVADEGHDVWLRKYDPDGNEIWTRTYGGAANGDDSGLGIAVDSDDGVLVAGYETTLDGGRDVWIRKYDEDGVEIWTVTHAGADGLNDYGTSIALHGDGNFVVAGVETTVDEGKNVWFRRYDPDGNELWTRTHDGPASDVDEGRGISVDGDDDIVVVGLETGVESGQDVWIRKCSL